MGRSLKPADDIMALARRETDLHSRSVAGQITHRLRIGRAIGHSGRFDHARITAALEGKLDTARLSEDEEAAWLDAFTGTMGQPSDTGMSFFAERQALGQGVGLDAGGNLIHTRDNSAA